MNTTGSTRGTPTFDDWNALGKVIDRFVPDAFVTFCHYIGQLQNGTPVSDTCLLGIQKNNLVVTSDNMTGIGYGERSPA